MPLVLCNYPSSATFIAGVHFPDKLYEPTKLNLNSASRSKVALRPSAMVAFGRGCPSENQESTVHMTIHDIGRLAAIAAGYFNETPRFDYRAMREQHAAGRAYQFGAFVLIMADHSVGISAPPDLTANVGKGKAWRLRFFDGTDLIESDPEAFGLAYREPIFAASSSGEQWLAGYRIVTPCGVTFPEGELEERRRGFLRDISLKGYRLGKKAGAWLTSGM